MSEGGEPSRRTRLRSLKLRALVREHLGRDVATDDGVFPRGAALIDDGAAWVLVEDDPERGLGPALAWARRQGADRVHVLADRSTGLLARRAAAFAVPIEVWHVDERRLLPAVAEPLLAPPAPSPGHRALSSVIEAGGAVPVVEHGVVTGEVRGLEVCRVVDDPMTGAVRLEVGVGVHDREAFTMIHGDVPTVDALAGVVDAVLLHRRPGTVEHPLSRLVPERLLRWSLAADPAPIGLVDLVPVPPPQPRPNVKDRLPCSALGHRADGLPVVVVCSVGVDLDVIPYAIDARLAASRGGDAPGVGGGAAPGERASARGETIVVAPERDLVPITAELAGLVRPPVQLVGV